MRTIAPAPRTRPQPRRLAAVGALLLGVSISAIGAVVAGVLLALLGLPSDGWLALTLMLLAVGAGGWLAARRATGGWKHGLLTGLLVAALTLIVSFTSGDAGGVIGVVVVMGGCIAAGALGGWLARLSRTTSRP